MSEMILLGALQKDSDAKGPGLCSPELKSPALPRVMLLCSCASSEFKVLREKRVQSLL